MLDNGVRFKLTWKPSEVQSKSTKILVQHKSEYSNKLAKMKIKSLYLVSYGYLHEDPEVCWATAPPREQSNFPARLSWAGHPGLILGKALSACTAQQILITSCTTKTMQIII